MIWPRWPTQSLSFWLLYLYLFVLCLPEHALQRATLGERKFDTLSADSVAKLVALEPDPLKSVDFRDPNSHLSKILIPRAPDTDNITIVREYITTTLEALKWHIELDSFVDDTPIGKKNFTNIIATKDPEASRRVVLSAHYDSKWFDSYPKNQFVAATDSAAPCAFMLDLAEALNPLLDARAKRVEEELDDDDDWLDTTIQLVFFDGEEAFHEWTDTDSTYGSRHLAAKWASTYIHPSHQRRYLGHTLTSLGTIEHLILLDLLGAANPSLRNYYADTAWLFDSLTSAEKRLGDAGHFNYKKGGEEVTTMSKDKWKSWFRPRTSPAEWGGISDDHLPFLHRGVSILHLIANPFPKVWHSLKDDASALDLPTMRRWNILLRVFFAEYLKLRPEDADGDKRSIRREDSELMSRS